MEAFHSNYPYDPIHMLRVHPPMIGFSSQTGRPSEDDMRNSFAIEFLHPQIRDDHSSSSVSPFNHIGTLPLQWKHSQPQVLFFYLLCTVVLLNGTHLFGTLIRKTFDTRTILHSFESVLTIGSDTTC